MSGPVARPRGNALLVSDAAAVRWPGPDGLGPGFGRFEDSGVLSVLEWLPGRCLGQVACVSKTAYVFTAEPVLWKSLLLNAYNCTCRKSCEEPTFVCKKCGVCDFVFDRSWKRSCAAAELGGAAAARLLGAGRACEARVPVRGVFSDLLHKTHQCATTPINLAWWSNGRIRGTVERHAVAELGADEFVRRFDEKNLPVILTDVVTQWPAFARWDRPYLEKHCGAHSLATGGFAFSLPAFHALMDGVKRGGRDDQPLYLFDKTFAERIPQLKQDFVPGLPPHFAGPDRDLFSVLGAERPDHRWIIVGPAKSGSSFHIDPNGTSAWNAVIRGAKKWIFFPPDMVPPGVHPSADLGTVTTTLTAMEWMLDFYDRCDGDAVDAQGRRPLECVVRAGEMIFVPTGWWHFVINLEDGVALTQNFVTPANLATVLRFLRTKKEQVSGVATEAEAHSLGERFEAALAKHRPEILARARREKAEARARSAGPGMTSTWAAVTGQRKRQQQQAGASHEGEEDGGAGRGGKRRKGNDEGFTFFGSGAGGGGGGGGREEKEEGERERGGPW